MKEGQRQGKGGQLETPHPVTISDTHCLLSRFRRCTALGRTTLYYTALYYIAKYRDVQHTVESNGTVLQLEQSYATPGPHSNTAVQCSALQCSAVHTAPRHTTAKDCTLQHPPVALACCLSASRDCCCSRSTRERMASSSAISFLSAADAAIVACKEMGGLGESVRL